LAEKKAMSLPVNLCVTGNDEASRIWGSI